MQLLYAYVRFHFEKLSTTPVVTNSVGQMNRPREECGKHEGIPVGGLWVATVFAVMRTSGHPVLPLLVVTT